MFNVRIQHKYDSYQNWFDSEIILKQGELAVCEIPSGQSDSGLTPPAIGIKVGNGTDIFKNLKWIQSVAGDVYAWAKKENLEFADLSEEFQADLKQALPSNEYKFEFKNNAIVLYSKKDTEGADQWVAVGDPVEIDLTTKVDKVANAVAGDVATLVADGGIQDSGVKLADLAKTADVTSAIATAKGELEQSISGVNQQVVQNQTDIKTNADAIDALEETVATLTGGTNTSLNAKADKVTGATAGNVASLDANGNLADGGVAVSDLATKKHVEDNYATVAQLTATNANVTTNAGNITTLQGDVNTLSQNKVDKVIGSEGNVVAFGADGAISDSNVKVSDLAKSTDVADTYTKKSDFEELQGTVSTINQAVNTLNGTGEGSVKKAAEDAAAAAVNTFATEVTDNGKVEKFKELVNWVAEHGSEAGEMAAAIEANEAAIGTNTSAIAGHKTRIETLESSVSSLNSNTSGLIKTVSGVTTEKNGTDVKITGVSSDLLTAGSNTLVFYCGTASTVL